MKKHLTLIFLFLISIQSYGQFFAPGKLVVNATGLRFRSAPNVKSNIISKLEDGGLFDFISFVDNEEPNYQYYENLSFNWLKVRRQKTGKEGYVFGQYVTAASIGYKFNQTCSKLPPLNWYGIRLENEIPMLEKVQPEIKDDKYFAIITDSILSYVFLGTKNTYPKGPLNGIVFHNERNFEIRKEEERSEKDQNGNTISFEVCHDFDLADNEPINIKERLYFKIVDSKNKEILYQELTDLYHHIENLGFWIHFVGDVNKDGIHEIFMTSFGEKISRNLWFVSNGKSIDLHSITYYGPSC